MLKVDAQFPPCAVSRSLKSHGDFSQNAIQGTKTVNCEASEKSEHGTHNPTLLCQAPGRPLLKCRLTQTMAGRRPLPALRSLRRGFKKTGALTPNQFRDLEVAAGRIVTLLPPPNTEGGPMKVHMQRYTAAVHPGA